MRVSTNQMFYSGTSNILKGRAGLYKTQNQLSTGLKNQTASEDPVAATQSLLTTQSEAVNQTFLKNQSFASDQLAYMDTQLSNVADVLQDTIARSIQGGNGSLNSQDKQAIVEELKVRLASLVDLANTKDADGNYVFGGSRTNTQPFVASGNTPTAATGEYSLANTSMTYVGTDAQRMLQVESSQFVPTTQSGQDVFMRVQDTNGNITGKSVFDAVQNMINALNPATATVPSYDQALGDMQSALDHVLRTQASIGANMNRLGSLTDAGESRSVVYEDRLNKLNGLDYAEAISRLSQQQMQLEASQQSFAKVSKLSLFDVI